MGSQTLETIRGVKGGEGDEESGIAKYKIRNRDAQRGERRKM